MKKRKKSRFMFCDRWIDRNWIVGSMEAFQDLIVMVLCGSMFAVMLLQLWGIFRALSQPLNYKQVTAQILFILILVELFRLLVVYLQEHSIAVGVAVEIAIVSLLREVVVHGALDISWVQALSISGLLFVLGALLVVCAKIPHMDCMSAQTKFCPSFPPESGSSQHRNSELQKSNREALR
ncbi:phosphate-starvation-inducible PsiE family protein [Mastigocoleus sp. MO_188.B34]|uniref:phosphate-starvation-inducible PsiE family protein n=1 Tax=Mastigocoleus sp. MO_188.B34 TaxID=3036635 RepID=UPI0026198273|nr:phosphate-starvation-inducible PsiE family protein [Mastigocoleus sp. MO_188.B34]MDJ0697287.1 phosphate-starvation-inducible PsiE family protein [Mastigocoleus sp. MO_188.B34]